MDKSLSKAPKGSIRYIQRKGNVQYYLRMKPGEKNGQYVHKSEIELIKTYLQKSYDEKALDLLKKEEAVLLQPTIETFERYQKELQDLYSDSPKEVKNFIEPIDVSDSDYAKLWLAMPYTRKAIDENIAIYKTNNEEYVRSKSELNIANALYQHRIPYKYECPLELRNGNVIHPDFTILNTHSRKVYYWEHRGMMDDRSYAQNAVKRNKEYLKSGIIVGRQLIITEETSLTPLPTVEIEAVIKELIKQM